MRRPTPDLPSRRSGVHRRRPHAVRRLLRATRSVLVAAVLSAPLAAVFGLAHAEVTDYLGPHRSTFTTNFSGETRLDLGPLGNAYLPLSVGPVGMTVEVGGLEGANGNNAYLSTQTLTAYSTLYTDPEETITGVRERLTRDVVTRSLIAEGVLLLIMLGWSQRRFLLADRPLRATGGARSWIAYAVLVAVCVGSAAQPVPDADDTPRLPVDVTDGTRFAGTTVDSKLLADLLDTGIKGVRLLARRQSAAVDSYIATASDSLVSRSAELARPRTGESVLFGYSDLHCSIAMTEVLRRTVALVDPVAVFSSGDDTMNGTAVERSCITRETSMADGRPFVVATGNHDSDVTDAQFSRAGARVLDGRVLDVAGIDVLGDDDPEYNIPFSVGRRSERAETEAQLGQRMVSTATGRDVDVLLVHQPRAAEVITATPNPPAKLIAWGHMHTQAGPRMILHDDGSWTVAIQQGTAGGIAQPTITSFSTPFTPPRKTADSYLYFRDDATGLITGVQAVHFGVDGTCVIDPRIDFGDLAALPEVTRRRLGGAPVTPGTDASATPPPTITPTITPTPGTVESPTGSPAATSSAG